MHTKQKVGFLLSLILLLTMPFIVLADTQYDEATAGDLSDDRANPTAMQLSYGSNKIQAVTSGGDREYVTINVPSGMVLDTIFVEDYVSTDGSAFIAIQAGTQFTEPPLGTSTANLLGYTLFGFNNGTVGFDILSSMGSAAGTIGFSGPLASGDYTFWIQQTGATTTYTLDLKTSPAASVTVYDDSSFANGDISDDRLQPTTITPFGTGSIVRVSSLGGGDLEYFTLTVPSNYALKAILLNDYQSQDDLAFIAIQAGSTFTEAPSGASVASLLGYTHFGTGLNQVGSDILDDMGSAGGAIGFSSSLSPGSYTFWAQQGSGIPTIFELEFVLESTITYTDAIYLPIVVK